MAWFSPSGNVASTRRDRSGVFFVRALVTFLLAYTTWVWAGLRPSFHWVAVAVSAILLAGFFVEGRWTAWRAVRGDPVFFLGLAFVGYLAIQWLNAGRTQYFDVGYQRWMYMPPRWPGWPWAFAKGDAMQMLTWFFPAWTIAVVIRVRKLDRRDLRGFMTFLAYNAGLLAIFGLFQFAKGGQSIYWIQPLKGHFFASFAYGNHVAPYFVLAGGLSAGLLYREIFDVRCSSPDRPSSLRLCHPWRVAALLSVFVLCLVAANLGYSRAGVILAGVLTVFAAGYGWVRGWSVLSPAARLNFAALSLAALGGLYFTVAGLGETSLRKEFSLKPATPDKIRTLWDRVDLELGGRPQYLRAAFDIWREEPWFGVGGWGYKYLVATHIPEKFWPVLDKRGWANVHCDFLQFLAEFGVVGFGLLAGALAVMVREAMDSRRCRRNAFWTMGMAGLALVVVFSLVDLPFRCPAILYTWVALLAALPQICPAANANGSGKNRENGWTLRATAERGLRPGRIPA